MTKFISERFRKFAIPLALAAEIGYAMFIYGYKHKAQINENFPMENYVPLSTVAFTAPQTNEISMPSLEKMEYQDGVHAWPFVIMHEEMHIDGEYNESAINARCRARLGYSKDPFPGYPYV